MSSFEGRKIAALRKGLATAIETDVVHHRPGHDLLAIEAPIQAHHFAKDRRVLGMGQRPIAAKRTILSGGGGEPRIQPMATGPDSAAPSG